MLKNTHPLLWEGDALATTNRIQSTRSLVRLRGSLRGPKGIRKLIVASLCLVCFSNAIATVRAVSLSQYDHTAWKSRAGAPPQILALAQTKDGYLWLGTANGLFHFDGVRFEQFQPRHSEQLLHSSVTSLLATPDGELWVGYSLGGITRIKGNRAVSYPLSNTGTIWSMVQDSVGEVWAGTANGLFHFSKGQWSRELASQFSDDAYRLFFDKSGTLWITTDKYLYKRTSGSTHLEKTRVKTDDGTSFAVGPDGTEWIECVNGVMPLDDALRDPDNAQHLLKEEALGALRFDKTGGLWVQSFKHGIFHIADPTVALKLSASDRKAHVEHFRSINLLSSDRALTELVDQEGNLWVGTADGLDRFRETALSSAPFPSGFGFYAVASDADGAIFVGTESDGLQRFSAGKLNRVTQVTGKGISRITCVYRSRDGKLWLGGAGGLGYLDHGRFFRMPLPEEFEKSPTDTQALTVDGDGDLWLQTEQGRTVRLHQGKWIDVPHPPHSGAAVVRIKDRSNRIWAGYMAGYAPAYDKGLVAVTGNGSTRTFTSADGLTVGNTTAIYDDGKEVWIGGEHGLNVMLQDHLAEVHFQSDHVIEGVSGIARLADGSMWLNSMNGVLKIPAQEVDHLLQDFSYPVHFRLFDSLDGLEGKAPQIRPLPSIIEGSDGKLWFTTTNGAFWLDPQHLRQNGVIPPVHLTSLVADGETMDLDHDVWLRKGVQEVEFDYTALSLSIPERVRFRYKLEGFDKDWQDAGTRRQAFYTHLPPGSYTFHVIACNEDDLWNQDGAAVRIMLSPTFLQSIWFKILCGLVFIACAYIAFLYRLAQMTKLVRTRMRERVIERERIARDLHDSFLQGIQGLVLSVNVGTKMLRPDERARPILENALSQFEDVLSEGRELVFDLRKSVTTEPGELEPLLLHFAQETYGDAPARLRIWRDGDTRPLHPLVLAETYKILREALINAFRHSGAKTITIELSYGEADLCVAIADDGLGIPPDVMAKGGREGHFGLQGMRERAEAMGGRLSIRRKPEGGTTIQFQLKSGLAYKRGRSSWFRHLFANVT